ncbi:MAG TPA: ATP-binding protein [bacterium]|nr:ATP-binding protein [bacterium]
MIKRKVFNRIFNILCESRKFIHVLAGPRQVGKTTVINQVIEEINIPSAYFSADDSTQTGKLWIQMNWEAARIKVRTEKLNDFVLVFDEIQKIPDWTEMIKKLWDEDSLSEMPIKVVLLGSSTLLIQQGLTESLAGRFEITRLTHWSYPEMEQAFSFSVEQYIYFGGYPGAATLINDEERWKNYVRDSIVETTISKDILLMKRIDKPALLRQLFYLGASYSGQILSLNKMMGQLQDAGNTTTLSHYTELLDKAGMVKGLQKYASQQFRQRNSSPKFIVYDTAFLTVQLGISFEKAVSDRALWGRVAESAVGAYLVNQCVGKDIELFYWRESPDEVDFVLKKGENIVAIEVKTGFKNESLKGMSKFIQSFPKSKPLLIGTGGIPVADFFKIEIEKLF